MAVLDFLFQGSPPANVTSTTTDTTALPAWYQEYMRGLLSTGNAIAAAPYTSYQGPRIAGFTDDQTSSFGQTRNLPNVAMPTFDAATSVAKTGALGDVVGSIQPYANTSSNLITSASSTLPNNIGSYMSPYTQSVTDEIARLGNRNFQENIMPGVMDAFTSAGQFGSGRNAEILGRAARDTQADITGKQATALESGYTTAGNLYNSDMTRLANLANASTNLASTIGTVGNQQYTRGILGSQAMTQAGQAAEETALKNAAALQAVGQQQQQQNQSNLDLAYKDFTEQRDYDKAQTYYLNDLLRGMQNVGSTTSTTSNAPLNNASYGASPLNQILAANTVYNSLSNGSLFSARGGIVKKSKMRKPKGGALSIFSTRGGLLPMTGGVA